MKLNKLILLTFISIFFMSSCQSQKSQNHKEFQISNAKDSASYAIGVQIANNFAQGNLIDALSMEAIYEGLKDVQSGKAKIEIQNTDRIINDYFSQIMAEQSADVIKKGEEFLAQKEKEEGVKKTASGLLYKELQAGTGASPKANDQVKTHYRGKLIDGTEFDSSYSRGEPTTFPVNAVIAGWTEALQLMKVGAKWELYIPYNLAYGERGAGQLIGPYETLIFEIELLSIE